MLKILLISLIFVNLILIPYLAAFGVFKKNWNNLILLIYLVVNALIFIVIIGKIGYAFAYIFLLFAMAGLIFPDPIPGLITSLYGFKFTDIFVKIYNKLKPKH